MSRSHTRLDWASALAQAGNDLLAHELQAERASALGRAGRRLERVLAALADALSAEAPSTDGPRNDGPRTEADRLTDEAGRIAWEFMVMREMPGLRDWPEVVRLYAIPANVQRRIGVAPTLARPEGGG